MKTYQFREMTTPDVENELKDSRDALENYRFQHATGQLENYKALKNMKKDIAKMVTVLKEREMGINEKLDKTKEKTKDKKSK
jgi:large subunit ribosomal protein L29